MLILCFLSAVFQAGGLVVALVEVTRKSYLGSIVPVIVNAVLGEHQVVLDIVAFVPRGDFPRSRLGEKQHGKILASWVTRKMRTIAQFSIRDADVSGIFQSDNTERHSSSKSGSIVGLGSHRHSTPIAETGDLSGLQQMEPVSRGGKGPDEPVEHYPPSRSGISDPRPQAYPDNAGVTEHYKPFEASDFDIGDHPDSPRGGSFLRAASPVDPDLRFTPQNHNKPPIARLDNGGGGATAGGKYDEFHSTPGITAYSNSPPHSPPPITSPPYSQQSQGPLSSAASLQTTSSSTTATLPRRGRDSLPSQQLRYSNIPAGSHDQWQQPQRQSSRISSYGSHGHPQGGSGGGSGGRGYQPNEDHWPEEAVRYQQQTHR
jgi:hypothetical protein